MTAIAMQALDLALCLIVFASGFLAIDFVR